MSFQSDLRGIEIYTEISHCYCLESCSNQTFEELKSSYSSLARVACSAVPIRPSRNWNSIFNLSLNLCHKCSNQTFEELKLCRRRVGVLGSATVPIRPSRNWNGIGLVRSVWVIIVPIRPSRNWNINTTIVVSHANPCSNQTFEELKWWIKPERC